MQLLHRRSPAVRAVQFTGDNAEEMAEFGEEFGIDVYFRGATKKGGTAQSAVFYTPLVEATCNIGDWIVEEPSSPAKLIAVSTQELRKMYYAVGEPND